MRIYHSPEGDPMLIDAMHGLHSLAEQIECFVESPSLSAVFAAEIAGNPAPYTEFLLGLRITKGNVQQLTITDDRWLEFNASPQDLQSFLALLREPTGGTHCHLHSTPVSLIVEEGTPWIAM